MRDRDQPHLAAAAARLAARNAAGRLAAVTVAVVLVATGLAAGRLADRGTDGLAASRLAAAVVPVAMVLAAAGLAARRSGTARGLGGAAGSSGTARLGSRSTSRGRSGTRGLGGGTRGLTGRGTTAITTVVAEAGFGIRRNRRKHAGDKQSGQQVTEFHGRLLDVKKVGGKGSWVRRRFATVCGVCLSAVRVSKSLPSMFGRDCRPLASVVLRSALRAS